MDTKLKNSKKGILTGSLLVVIVTILFMALFPWFEREVEQNYALDEAVLFENEGFIDILLKSNYVLYQDVKDKSGVDYTVEDLYLKVEEQELEDHPYAYDYEGVGAMLLGAEEDVKGIYIDQIESELETIRKHYVEGIALRMDYCVIDNKTGTVLKNTSQSIEKLFDKGAEWENPYAYYVVLQYDGNGTWAEISAKGKNTENFLKHVQLETNDENCLLLEGRKEVEQYAVVDEETELVEKRVMFRQKKPENVSFAYAMTKEQMDTFLDCNVYDWDYLTDRVGYWDYEYAFQEAGVGNVFLLLLAGMAVIVFIGTKLGTKKETVIAEGKRSPSLEVMLAVVIVSVPMGYGITIAVAAGSYQDYYIDMINNLIPAVHMQAGRGYDILECVMNFCILAVVFGSCYWCLWQMKDIVHGIGAYVRQHSILVRSWNKISTFVKRECRKFKEEVLDVDLAKDNKKVLIKLISLNFVILAIICCFWGMGIPVLVIYSFVVYGIVKKYIYNVQWQYKKLLEATNSIAEGKLNNTFEEDFGVFESYKEELYKIQGGFRKAVDEEVKSQRMKTELITNVSHDLKTPLTAIITYIDLLKEENVTKEQRKEYLDTLDRKAMRLKILIEDLFEVSKANSGNVKMEPVPVDICNLLRQVYLEHEEKMKQSGFDVRFTVPEEKVILQLDSQKTYRIFENLYVNVIKYAMPNTRVYVSAETSGESGIHIEMKNMSAQEININPQDLTERFVRGDASRNTEGSGLGLAIAKSFTELQGGKFLVETDGDLFKVIIEW